MDKTTNTIWNKKGSTNLQQTAVKQANKAHSVFIRLDFGNFNLLVSSYSSRSLWNCGVEYVGTATVDWSWCISRRSFV